MERFRLFVKGAAVSLLLFAAVVYGTEILGDDFTDADVSNAKWVSSPPQAVTIGDGTATVNNSANATGSAELVHVFGTPKPSTFTISLIVKSVTGQEDAGVFFCRNEETIGSNRYINGYYLTIFNNMVAVFKFVDGSGNTVFNKSSFDLEPTDNKLMISKSGSEFNVFLNDQFQGTFTDSQYPSGDVSIYVSKQTSAVFSDFRMTDTFTPSGDGRTSFTDNFSNPELRYWNRLSAGGTPTIEVTNSVLHVNVPVGAVSWMYVDLSAADFSARAVMRHASDSLNEPYGILLVGAAPSGSPIPMVHFAIRGDRRWAIWSPRDGGSYSPAVNSDIRGSTGWDTLEVRKMQGASTYEFFANGAKINDTYAIVDFPIVGMGIFTYGGMAIHYDHFHAQREGATSVRRDVRPPQRNRNIREASPVAYDLRGRRLATVPTTRGRAPARAAGVYVNENGREVLIRGHRARDRQ